MTNGLRIAALILLLAAPASAELKLYPLQGDQSTLLPALGAEFRSGVVGGLARIEDTGNGIPTLVDLELTIAYSEAIDGVNLTGIPGTTLYLDDAVSLAPAPGQTGVGDTTTSISWGSLTGWTQLGRLVCITNLPGDPGPQLPQPGDPSGCTLLYDFEGTGPPLTLTATTLATGPWSFAPDGSEFGPTASVEISNLGGGTTRQAIRWSGTGIPALPVPALPALGLAVLGAALVGLAFRRLRRQGDGRGRQGDGRDAPGEPLR